ncbi:alpha-L-fucosidase [Rhodanobacter glycinis]|uniref:alpha-L-fucosidase n=1 Tax=Rhodanobacter glycinis TaxID=582702 RepID=A0A1I4FXV7_9GAMM|nr:alpha-L-fucosidase [Rhodanobacter glycinis]SFL22742.1 alpha-L-fucosidase [Rhodanobacter glycinis]
MNIIARAALALALLLPAVAFATSATITDQPLPLPQGGPRPDAATVHAWQARKFGLFIHFGLYSMLGGVWDGRRITNGYSEQIQSHAPVPIDQYEALAKRFDPVKFDPDAIVALAKAAGMKFIVLTAKHHDGFAMFHTAQNRYNVVDATPYRRDVVKELADACARARMPFGVYYSTIDWHWMHGQYRDDNDNPITPAQADFNVAQIRELMSHYGAISEVWFDMGKPTPAQSARFARTVHELQPKTMVSGRVWNHQGDFSVMGDNSEPGVGMEEPWQSPASMFPDTWGYRSWEQRNDLPGKIRENIARLVRVVSAGGNYILNIGPEGDGSVVPYEADVLRGIGAWLKPRSAAIYGTRAAPFAKLNFGYATLGAHTLYLFVEKPPADGVLHLPGVVGTRFGRGRVLADARASVGSVAVDASGAAVKVENLAGAGYMPVVAIPFEGKLHVRPDAVAPDADGHVHLAAAQAEHFLNYNGYGYNDPPTVYKLRWHAQVGAGDDTLTVHYRGAQARAKLDVWVDGHPRTLALPAGDGTAHLRVSRDPRVFPYAMQVELTPVTPFRKGDRLPATIESVELAPLMNPVTSPHGEGRSMPHAR